MEGLLATSDKRLTRKTNLSCFSLFYFIFINGMFQDLLPLNATK